MTNFDDVRLQRLKTLLEITSPSMQEREMQEFLLREWKEKCPSGEFKTDALGNLEFSVIKDNSYPTLALVAHADTVCVQITSAIGNGKFKFRSVGLSPHTLLGQQIVVITEDGEKFDGVIGFDATSQYGQPKGLIFEDLWIDIPGVDTQKISPGDLAVLRPCISITNKTITAPGLDDRVGLFIMGEALRYYAENLSNLKLNLICVATAQEEVGLRGSGMFNFSHFPNAIIILDVDYATDIPTPHEDQMGRLWLHHGPGLQRKADNSPKIRKMIMESAKGIDKPFQISLGRFLYGSTDGTQLQMTRNPNGYSIANFSIPCRYMHSPSETVSRNDISASIDILCELINNLSAKS